LINGIFTLSGAYPVNSDRRPTTCSLEFMDAMTFQKDIQDARSKVVVAAILEDDVNVKVLHFIWKYLFRHVTPPST
jgi:hypothetical protein